MALENEVEDINWSEPFDTSSASVGMTTEETAPIPDECIKKLRDSFGHSEFRKMQWKIISSILNDNRDNCVIMATGYGKSLCFQFPSVYKNTITIVVSPLISLMQDQVTAMRFYNLKACFLGSAQTKRETVFEVIDRQYNVVYVTPEYITSESGSFLIEQIKQYLTLIAIDEAHCISKWGHDFRSAYRKLNVLREWCPSVPILAMTATATNKVRDDIVRNLRLKNPQITSTGFDRPNLEFRVQPKTDVWKDIGPHIQNVKIGSVIVYCITRRMTEEIAQQINAHGHLCRVYHAGLSLKDREKTHDDFIHDRIRVVVATIAFGMGINKPDVRLVIHYGVSKDVEGYYQEVGRAGRDGLPSKCLLFHRTQDWTLHRRIRLASKPNTTSEQMEKLLQAIREYVDTKDCRRRFILNYFGEDCKHLTERLNCCDNCKLAMTGPVEPINLYNKYQGLDVDGRLDITEEAKLLLNLLKDMKSRFGLRKAILVLRGSKNKDVPSAFSNHYTFGKLKHKTEKWIQAVANSLVETNMLALEEVRETKFTYTKCVLTNKAKVWLSGLVTQSPIKINPNNEFISLLNPRIVTIPKINPETIAKKEETQSAVLAKPSISTIPSISLPNGSTLPSPSKPKTDILRPLLKARSKLASLFGVMPYLVASTKALEQLAKIQPMTMEEFRKIRLDGYSEEKTQRFGPVFVKVVNDFHAKTKQNNDKNGNEEISEENSDQEETSTSEDEGLKSQTENKNPCSPSTSIEIIEPPAPPIFEIEDDNENSVFDELDLIQVGVKVEAQLSSSGSASANKTPSTENHDLDLLIDALESDDLKQNDSKNLKPARSIDKKPSANLEYESDSGSDIFDADWDLEIDESDLSMISQQVEEQIKCNTTTNKTNATGQKVQLEVSNSQSSQKACGVKQGTKTRIIERKKCNAFEYEDDSESDTDTKPKSPKKRVLPSWMQPSRGRK